MADNHQGFQHNRTGSQIWKPCCLDVYLVGRGVGLDHVRFSKGLHVG